MSGGFRGGFRQLPNILTTTRLVATPLIVIIFLMDLLGGWRDAVVMVLFLAAMSTDFFDGFLARRLQVASRVGKFLDPVADKFLVVTCLLLLLAEERASVLAVAIIVLREFYLVSLREWMAIAGRSARVGVSAWGKWKTGMQTTAVAMLFFYDDLLGLPIFFIGTLFLWAAVALSLISMALYTRAAFAAEEGARHFAVAIETHQSK